MSDSALQQILGIYSSEFHQRFTKEEINDFLNNYPSLNCTISPFGGSSLNQKSTLIFLIVIFSISSTFLIMALVCTIGEALRFKRTRRSMSQNIELRRRSQGIGALSVEHKKRLQDEIRIMYATIHPEYIEQVTENMNAAAEEEETFGAEGSSGGHPYAHRHLSLENDADNLLRFIISGRRGTDDSVISSDSNNQPLSSISNGSESNVETTEEPSSRALKHPSIADILRKKSIQDSPLMTTESFRSIRRYNKRRLGLSFQETQSRGNSPLPPRKSLPAVSFEERKK